MVGKVGCFLCYGGSLGDAQQLKSFWASSGFHSYKATVPAQNRCETARNFSEAQAAWSIKSFCFGPIAILQKQLIAAANCSEPLPVTSLLQVTTEPQVGMVTYFINYIGNWKGRVTLQVLQSQPSKSKHLHYPNVIQDTEVEHGWVSRWISTWLRKSMVYRSIMASANGRS